MLESGPSEKFIEKFDAIIRLEYGIDPDSLTDDEWYKRVVEYRYVEQRRMEKLKEVLVEVVAMIFPKKQ